MRNTARHTDGPLNGRYAVNPTDDTITRLRATVDQHLQPPVNRVAAEFWQTVLGDHVRNQHRMRIGMDVSIQRWDRTAPERRVIVVAEDERDAA